MELVFGIWHNPTGFLLLVMTIMVLFDYVTGVIKALKAKDVISSKLREGLWRKIAFFMAVPLAYLVSETFSRIATGMPLLMEQVTTGAPWLLMDGGQIVVPGVEATCVFIIFIEAVSIFENLCEINPELAKSPLASVLHITKDE